VPSGRKVPSTLRLQWALVYLERNQGLTGGSSTTVPSSGQRIWAGNFLNEIKDLNFKCPVLLSFSKSVYICIDIGV
jgi:hypothetical protein